MERCYKKTDGAEGLVPVPEAVVADVDVVRAEDATGIIVERRQRWLAVIFGCPCGCGLSTKVLGSYSSRTQAAGAIADLAADVDGVIEH
jgi:hypothetical protein